MSPEKQSKRSGTQWLLIPGYVLIGAAGSPLPC